MTVNYCDLCGRPNGIADVQVAGIVVAEACEACRNKIKDFIRQCRVPLAKPAPLSKA